MSFLEGAIMLIVVYLVLVNWQGFVRSIQAASAGSVGLVKAFQGR